MEFAEYKFRKALADYDRIHAVKTRPLDRPNYANDVIKYKTRFALC
jgi:hypothetical protein